MSVSEHDPKERAVLALAQRLRAAGGIILPAAPAPHLDPAVDAATMIDALVDHVVGTLARDEMWLIYTAISTVFPSEETVRAALRYMEVHSTDRESVLLWLMETCLHAARSLGSPTLEMDVVVGAVVVDVDFSAQHEHNTGIQRVVRNTVPVWNAHREIVLVAWLERDSAMRTLDGHERDRVLSWGDPDRHNKQYEESTPRIVVPWRSVVVLSEVPSSAFVSDAIAAIGSVSGNQLTAIGYDAIPTVSADMVPWDMADHFARYLTIVKSMSRLAGISAAAAAEFQGFVDMLSAQGLAGPIVVECELPDEVPERSQTHLEPSGPPIILVVGSKEPRKNHVPIMYAAERLWREGLTFELRFIGTYGWSTVDFRRWYDRLRRAGRPISAPQRVGDDDLWKAYEDAAFAVFPSLHEGYGLPVAEALSHGTPVITSDYGSTAEIAVHGGCLLVDPRNDEAILDAMRSLLTDRELRAALSAEALARPNRTWRQYSDELWTALVDSGTDARSSERGER